MRYLALATDYDGTLATDGRVSDEIIAALGRLQSTGRKLILVTGREGVDDETWLYHLQLGDYSRWFRSAIKDESLAEEVEKIEQTANISASESRAAIKAAIEQRYTMPA